MVGRLLFNVLYGRARAALALTFRHKVTHAVTSRTPGIFSPAFDARISSIVCSLPVRLPVVVTPGWFTREFVIASQPAARISTSHEPRSGLLTFAWNAYALPRLRFLLGTLVREISRGSGISHGEEAGR